MKIKIYNGMKNFQKSLFALIVIVFVVFLPAVSWAQKNGTISPPSGNGTISPSSGNGTISPSSGNSTNNSSGGANAKIENPLKNKNINSVDGFIKVILEGVIKISIPIVALAIIYSGFLFVSARGNTEKLGKAKQALLYTCIGAAILLGSWAIAQVISNTVLAL